MDLNHDFPYKTYEKFHCDISDRFQKVVVITAGASQKPGENRLDLSRKELISSKNPVQRRNVLAELTGPPMMRASACIDSGSETCRGYR